jgi:hypothetical protein
MSPRPRWVSRYLVLPLCRHGFDFEPATILPPIGTFTTALGKAYRVAASLVRHARRLASPASRACAVGYGSSGRRVHRAAAGDEFWSLAASWPETNRRRRPRWAGSRPISLYVPDGFVTAPNEGVGQSATKTGGYDLQLHDGRNRAWMQIHLIPALRDAGVRLFADLESTGVELRKTMSFDTPGATHLRFSVVK